MRAGGVRTRVLTGAALLALGCGASAAGAHVGGSARRGCTRHAKHCSVRLRYRVSRPPHGSNPVPEKRRGQFGAGPYANARVAQVALGYLGQISPFGECKPSVNAWVKIASGGAQRLGGSYYADYQREGGIKVGRDQTVEGDIIQLNNPRDLSSNVYYAGMHTAVIVGHAGGSNTFDVVDSNYGPPHDMVHRHAWNPYEQAARYGLVVEYWQMGSASAPTPPPTAPTAPPSVHLTSPTAESTVGGTIQLSASAEHAGGVEFDAYYATDPGNVATVGWHKLGDGASTGGGIWSYTLDTRSIPNQGNVGWGTVNIAAIALDSSGAASSARDYRRVTISNQPGETAPPNRTAITSYDQMRPGAPFNGQFIYAYQAFVAQSNTITAVGVTVGKSGAPAGYSVNIRLCTNQPDGAGNCNVIGQTSPQVVNFGDSEGDLGDVAVSPGASYYIVYFPPEPYGSGWLTYWWSGGPGVSNSDQMQAVVHGYNR